MAQRPVPRLELPLLTAVRPPRFPSSRNTTARMPTTVLRLKPQKSRKAPLSTSVDEKRKSGRAPLEKVVRNTQLKKLLASKRGVLEPKDWTGAAENGPVLREMYEHWALEYTLASRRPEALDPESLLSLRRKGTRAKSVLCRAKDLPPVELNVTCQGLFKQPARPLQVQSVLSGAEISANSMLRLCAMGSAPAIRAASVPRPKQRVRDRETDTADLEFAWPAENDENFCPNQGLIQ